MMESIAANLATNRLVFLWGKVKESFFDSKSDFEKELVKVIYSSLEEYGAKVLKPLPKKVPFYLSQVFLTELLSFKFSNKFRIK